jgi:hypothetical protein
MLMSSWWFWWMIFMFFFLLWPVSYGWGYRGWGPPYPRYIQRRRHDASLAHAHSGSAVFDHHAWGWGGDVLWVVVTIGLIWAVTALLWR